MLPTGRQSFRCAHTGRCSWCVAGPSGQGTKTRQRRNKARTQESSGRRSWNARRGTKDGQRKRMPAAKVATVRMAFPPPVDSLCVRRERTGRGCRGWTDGPVRVPVPTLGRWDASLGLGCRARVASSRVGGRAWTVKGSGATVFACWRGWGLVGHHPKPAVAGTCFVGRTRSRGETPRPAAPGYVRGASSAVRWAMFVENIPMPLFTRRRGPDRPLSRRPC